MGVHQNGWFIRIPLEWMIWGYPYFSKPPRRTGGGFRLLRNPLRSVERVKCAGTQAQRPADVESSESARRDLFLYVSLGTISEGAYNDPSDQHVLQAWDPPLSDFFVHTLCKPTWR